MDLYLNIFNKLVKSCKMMKPNRHLNCECACVCVFGRDYNQVIIASIAIVCVFLG